MRREDSKKVYETPEAEVIRFEDEDVITQSTQGSEVQLPPVSGSSLFNLY